MIMQFAGKKSPRWMISAGGMGSWDWWLIMNLTPFFPLLRDDELELATHVTESRCWKCRIEWKGLTKFLPLKVITQPSKSPTRFALIYNCIERALVRCASDNRKKRGLKSSVSRVRTITEENNNPKQRRERTFFLRVCVCDCERNSRSPRNLVRNWFTFM